MCGHFLFPLVPLHLLSFSLHLLLHQSLLLGLLELSSLALLILGLFLTPLLVVSPLLLLLLLPFLLHRLLLCSLPGCHLFGSLPLSLTIVLLFFLLPATKDLLNVRSSVDVSCGSPELELKVQVSLLRLLSCQNHAWLDVNVSSIDHLGEVDGLKQPGGLRLLVFESF